MGSRAFTNLKLFANVVLAAVLLLIASTCGLKKFDARSAVNRALQPTPRSADITGPVPAEVNGAVATSVPSSTLAECAGLSAEDSIADAIPQNEIDSICSALSLLDFKTNPENEDSESVEIYD